MLTDAIIRKYIKSYNVSQIAAKKIFNNYMRNFLTISRDLRTDPEGVTTLLDNVPSVFDMTDESNLSYFCFPVNFDLNVKGTFKLTFDCRKPVRVYISDTIPKPSANNCDKVVFQH